MPKFAANLTMLYNELGFLERFDAAAAAGFRAVEFLFPYAFPAAEIRARLERNRLALVLHNLPAGNWEAGERGIACHPDRVGEFQDGVGKAIDYAKALGVPQLNCLAGIVPQGIPRDAAQATFIANLAYAADKLKAEGLRLLIEPINTYDIPGFFLSGTRQGLEIIDATGSDNLFLQYDIYHMQRMEGELANTIKKNLPRIRHLQLADNPGRNEPGTGEINYGYLFRVIDSLGYDGWIGCEYKPATTTAAGLSWMDPYRR
jgi:hydroxypyruvate isomerase